MNKDGYHDYGAAPIKGEGQTVSYDTVQRTPEEVIEFLRDQLRDARVAQGRYSRIRRMARNQQLMVANKNGFTLVEDLDEYMENEHNYSVPLTRAELIKEGLAQMEDAFRQGYAQNYTGPKVTL